MKWTEIVSFTGILSLVFSAGFSAEQSASRPAASAPASKPASSPAGEWTKLFEGEAWYKSQAGKEETFAGKLEAVPQKGPNILMRTSYYKLGSRNIYTGGKKVDALDKLVGKRVEFRGKAVDFELEGTSVSEIWPAAVRAAE